MDIKYIDLILLFGAFSAVLSPVLGDCEPGWYPYYDQCYYISSNRYRYTDYQSQCATRNATLWVYKSQDEVDWVQKIMEQGPRILYWTGLQLVNKHWTWIDGTTYNKNNVKWYRNTEGDVNSNNKCAGMIGYVPQQGQYQQKRCTDGWGIVCTRPKDMLDLCHRSDNWKYLDGWCLKLFDQKQSWSNARQTCHDNGGDLTIYKNYLELLNLDDLMDCKSVDNIAWIGLSDTVKPRTYLWINNDTVRYSRWFSYANQILKNGSTCWATDPTQGWAWRHYTCDQPLKFVCNRSLGVCPNGWLSFRDRCYQPHVKPDSRMTWFDAKSFCDSQGTRLLVIDSDLEQGFIDSTIRSMQIDKIWLAFSDYVSNNTLAWIDGRLTTNVSNYQHWDANFPHMDPKRFDCGRIIRGRDSRWSNGYCFNYNSFMCQMKITTQPFTPPVIQANYNCDAPWQLYNGKCYYFGPVGNQSLKSWRDARDYCKASGGDLVVIGDAFEMSYVTVQQSKILTAWIGMKYDSFSKQLKWVDEGLPGLFWANETNFYPGEPDDITNGQQCIQIVGSRRDYSGSWDDGNCSRAQGFICEKTANPGSMKLPSTPPVPHTWSSYCGPTWIYDSNDNYCYQVVLNMPKTWAGARDDCVSRGGDLISVGGYREQNFIQAILNTGQYASIQVNFWIGATDQTREGGWHWTDNTPFRFLNWYAGEPNNYIIGSLPEDCAEMVPTWNYQWNDKKCQKEQNYICKKNALVTSPTALTPPSAFPSTTNCVGEAMMSGNYSLVDPLAFSASSTRDPQHLAINSRWYQGSMGAWSAKSTTAGQYVSATFYNTIVVKGIITAGRTDTDEWVRDYTLQYQENYYSEWTTYMDPPGTSKIFVGNTDAATPVTNMLLFPFEARIIRIMPTQWNAGISLRWEILGCVEESCGPDYAISGPLVVMDSQITASSVFDIGHKAPSSRLHPIMPGIVPACWKPQTEDTNQWIQADLGKSMIIRGVTTRGNPDYQEWVTSYRFQYSNKGTDGTYKFYQEPYGSPKTLTGNTDNTSPVTVYFKSHFQGRFIRILPKTSNRHMALAFDILVCQNGCSGQPLVTGSVPISDDQLNASTILDGNHGAFRARLNHPSSGPYAGAWIPKYQDTAQYLQVDLGYQIQITAISTQGAFDSQDWVLTYQLSYSDQGSSWTRYYEGGLTPKIFDGNWENKLARKHFMLIPFISRFIRIWPKTFHNRIALRVEIYGCPGPDAGVKIGCYADNPSVRDLAYEPFTDSSVGMWPPMCIDHCFRKGYYYAGVQAQYKCFCGNSYGRYGVAGDCTQACVPKTRFFCGGPSSNLIYTTGLSPQFKVCPSHWKAYNGRCYILLLDKKAWFNARADCKMVGGDLASPNSQAEQDFVYSLLQYGHGQDSWIGFNDVQDESLFQWTDGRQVQYSNWGLSQPNHLLNDNQDCVLMASQTGGWKGDSCDTQHQYVCQMDKRPSSQPSQATAVQGCETGWDGYRWSCYVYHAAPKTWMNARKVCATLGARMVRIRDRYEQAYISSVLGTKKGQYWTDISDTAHPGTYTYSDLTPYLQYTNWARNKPDNTSQCVLMSTGQGAGLWYNMPCNMPVGVVCEKMRVGFTSPAPLPVSTVLTPCDPGLIQTDKYCYQTNIVQNNKRLTWTKALDDCATKGGNLASFHSSDEMTGFLTGQIKQIASSPNANSYGPGSFWIGLNDRATENGFAWADKSPANFFAWRQNEPNNYHGSEDCVSMDSSGKWNDQACSNTLNWICMVKRGSHFISPTTVAAPTAGPAQYCGNKPGWLFYNNHCYYSDRSAHTWRESRALCQKTGADLLSITSPTEQLFVYYTLLRNYTSAKVWLGLNELDTNKGYRWSDQTVVTYLNWAKSEPNDALGQENCVNMWMDSGKWNDAHCGRTFGYACKQRVGALPTPAAPTLPWPGNCPTGYTALYNRCYKVYTQAVNWTTARDTCMATGHGYALASVRSKLENAFLTTLLADMLVNPWIGMSKNQIGSQLKPFWINNDDITYTNWAHGEPNGHGNEKCVQMWGSVHSKAGQWNDQRCSNKQAFICQTQKDATILTKEPIPSICNVKQNQTQFKMGCYFYVSDRMNWAAANNNCMTNEGGYLSSVNSEYEQAFMYLFMKENNAASIWIGLNDKANTGTYRWADSWPVVYSNWDAGEPLRGPGEGCVMMNSTGRWIDTNCTGLYPSICKTTLATPSMTPPPPNGTCGGGWYSNVGKCYYLGVNQPRNALDASFYCQQQKATLVSIHDNSTNMFLVKMISQLAHQGQSFWTSLHKSLDSGFQWIDGTALQFTNWRKGEPSTRGWSGNSENCGEVFLTDGMWNDEDCGSKRMFVCERPEDVDSSHIGINNIPTPFPMSKPFSLPIQVSPTLPHPQSSNNAPQLSPSTQKVVTPPPPDTPVIGHLTPRTPNKIVTPPPPSSSPLPVVYPRTPGTGPSALPTIVQRPYTGTGTPQYDHLHDTTVTTTSNTLGLSAGGLAGVIVGAIVFTLLVVGGILYWRRNTDGGAQMRFRFGSHGFDNKTYGLNKDESDDHSNGKRTSIALRSMSESSS